MTPAWRGVVVDGVVWAWPTLLMDHDTAFGIFPHLRGYTCRWRQWESGGRIDFDPDCTPEDRAHVRAWLVAAGGIA